jgi:hypothetical protein
MDLNPTGNLTFLIAFSSNAPGERCVCGLPLERPGRLRVVIHDGTMLVPVCRQCSYRFAPSMARLVDFEEGRPEPDWYERAGWKRGDVLAREEAVEWHLLAVETVKETPIEETEEPAEAV